MASTLTIEMEDGKRAKNIEITARISLKIEFI